MGTPLDFTLSYLEKSKSKVTQIKKDDWFRCGIAEAIWIAKENPSLNRDGGRHTLPPVYMVYNQHDQLLSSRDAHTTQGARDDTETADNCRRPEVSGRKLLTFT